MAWPSPTVALELVRPVTVSVLFSVPLIPSIPLYTSVALSLKIVRVLRLKLEPVGFEEVSMRSDSPRLAIQG